MDDRRARSKPVETSVDRYRIRCASGDGSVVLAWDYPGSTLLRVRIVRALLSDSEGVVDVTDAVVPAEPQPEPPAGSPWRVVYDGESGSFRDTGVTGGARYRYAVFARAAGGPWTLWHDESVLIPWSAIGGRRGDGPSCAERQARMSPSFRHKHEIVEHVHGLRFGTTALIAWDAGDAPTWVRVLRSPNDSASGANDADLLRLEQTLVYEGDAGELRDDDTIDSAPVYYYTLFARDVDAAWHEQVAVGLKPATEVHWSREEESGDGPSAERLAALRQTLPGA